MAARQASPTRQCRSTSIIVCFDSRWEKYLKTKVISVVFRKQAPRGFRPDWLYAYAAKPISAVIAKMSVHSLERLPIEEAVDLAEDGLLTEAELREYAAPPFAATWSELFVYRVGHIQVAVTPVTLAAMRDAWNYWPSPSFTPLSDEAKEMIDERANFAD